MAKSKSVSNARRYRSKEKLKNTQGLTPKTINVIPDGGDPPIPRNPNKLTIHQLRACAPLSVRKNITQKHLDLINSKLDDSELRDEYREHLLSWIGVMQLGRWKFNDYINAVKYVTHKLMGDTQQSAWVKVFPERYQRLIDKGIPMKDISGHVTMYNKSELVMKLCERTLPSLHVLNSDLLQEAINVSANLMRTAKSETVRMKSAATLIEHLKPPESLKVNLNVGVSNDTIEDLMSITAGLAAEQKKAIEAGTMSAAQVANMGIIKKRSDDESDADVVDAKFQSMDVDKGPKRSNRLADFFPGVGK